MESRGSNAGRGNDRRAEKGRRVWSPREEEVLINALKELIAEGWKTDNGFRVGYLGKLEMAMRKVFPGTDLKGQPHINSKIVGWKRLYAVVSGALGLTGVGYNETTGMLDCTNEQWQQIVKNDPNANGKWYIAFPMYKTWIEFFGKDRATGAMAEDVMEAVNELMNDEQSAKEDMDTQAGKEKVEPSGTRFEGDEKTDGICEEEGTSVCQNDKGVPRPKVSKLKRKHSDGLEGLFDLVGQICRSSEAKMDKIAGLVGYEHGLGETRKQLFDLIGRVPGLSTIETFDASMILAEKSDLLEMFICVPEAARAPFVRRLLEKHKSN